MERLTAGMVFEGYRDLCKFLGEKEKFKEDRQRQLTQWRKAFDFVQEGYKIQIITVYKRLPIIKEVSSAKLLDVRVLQLVLELKERLIGCELPHSGTVHISVRRRDLDGMLGLVNETFYSAKNNIDEETQNFLSDVRHGNAKIIDYLLMKLNKIPLVLNEKSYRVTVGGRKYDLGSEGATEIIKVQQEVIDIIGAGDKNILYLKGKLAEFYSKVNDILLRRFNISYCEDIIIFTVNDGVLTRYLNRNLLGTTSKELLGRSNEENVQKLRKSFTVKYHEFLKELQRGTNEATLMYLDKTIGKNLEFLSEGYLERRERLLETYVIIDEEEL